MIVSLALLAVLIAPPARADSVQDREYQIKAAFIYNFIKTVDWPKEIMGEKDKPITIGIVGKDLFGNAFDPVKDKLVKGRKVVIKRFGTFNQLTKRNNKDKTESQPNIEKLRKCHLLFVCSSENKDSEKIIKSVSGYSVLTVGEIKDFLETGGIINFIPKKEKGDFEVNLIACKHAKLKISSKLLRIAKRVIDEKPPQKDKD